MKSLVSLIVLTGLLGGCASQYHVSTIDGRTYTTTRAPEFVAGAYRFIDDQGESQTLYLSQVKRVDAR